MALSGSDVAYKQARAGIERAGASRAGFFTPNVVILIGGVDRTSKVQYGSVRITQNRNDESNTAAFMLLPSAGFTPNEGDTVVIGIGTSEVREFAGQILRKRHQRRRGNQTPWIEIECIDYLRLFDRRLVTTQYTSESATAIVTSIVDTYTSGFTRLNVAPGLDTIDFLPVTNNTPSQALRRIATLIGGGFYIDEHRDVHFFGSSGEPAARAPTAPVSLTNSLRSLKSFAHDRDASQIRTRVIVEGMRTRCPIPIVVSGFPSLALSGFFEIPIESREPFEVTAGLVRIGSVRLAHGGVVAAVNPAYSTETATVAADVAAGATSIQIDTFPTSTTTWCKIGEQFIYFGDTDTVPNRLIDIPASGQGSVQGAIKTGTQITYYPVLQSIASTAIPYDLPKDSDVVMYVQEDDAAAQATIAAIEGGDGIHEHVVSDGRLNADGATARALAELAAFSAAAVVAQWETDDLNARPGRSQVINLTVTDALSTTLTITRADVSFIAPNYRPRRRCEATATKAARLLDVLIANEE